MIAEGSLLDSSSNCVPITVSGVYTATTTFTNNNYIIVHANITSTGTFKIFTDTINGYYFIDSGRVNNNGSQAFKLIAHGKPIASSTANFTAHFNDSHCIFSVLSDTAEYTFASSGTNCPNANVNGLYQPGVALNASDTVNIIMNVTRPGSYSIQTPTVNGISFSAKGNFSSIGNYTVTLTGMGIPNSIGATVFPINIAGTKCSFVVSVASDLTGDSTMTWEFTVNGIDYKGFLDSAIEKIDTATTFPVSFIDALEVYGTPDGRSSINFELQVSRIAHVLSTGDYHPYLLSNKDFSGYVSHHDTTGNFSATYNQPSFTLTVTAYNTISRLIKGTFSGPVINEHGQTVTMMNGAFQTYYKH